MPEPGFALGPAAAPDVPLEHVVLQQVPILLFQIGEPGLQVTEHVLVDIASRHRLQGRRHQSQHRLVQNIAHGGGKHRNIVPGKDGLHQVTVGPVIPSHHTDVPKAEPFLPHQAENPGSGPLHLGSKAPGLEEPHRPPSLQRLLRLGTKQTYLQVLERWILSGAVVYKVFHFTGNPFFFCQPQQGRGGLAGGRKNALAPIVLLQVVAGEGDGHVLRLGHQLPKHLSLLGGEVSEAVQPQVLALGPGAPGQLVRHPGQPVPGVQGYLGRQGVVGTANEPQVPQLLPLRASGILAGSNEEGGRHAAAFQLVHGGQQRLEKGRPPGGPPVDRQLSGQRLNRVIHQQQPSASIQFLFPQPAGSLKHPVGQPAEGEHLSVPGHPVASHAA